MAIRKPEAMDECIYFTQRTLTSTGSGEIMAWVFRETCPKCGKDKMGKPRDSKGKVKLRSNEYVCPSCDYKVDKQEYEDSLLAYAEYTCPHCQKQGETKTIFNRKNINGVQTLRFTCEACSGFLDVTKKMKEKKKAKQKSEY